MIYTNSQPSFGLSSQWVCNPAKDINGNTVWYILDGPYEAKQTVMFPVSLPTDAVIKRAWLTMTLGDPMTGAAYQRVNDMDIPKSGEVEAQGLTALMSAFQADFTFKANGKVFEDTNTHSSYLSIENPTLHVEYEAYSEEGDGEDAPSIPDRINSAVGMPRLLDNNLREIARIEARTALALNLTPLSTARLKVAPGEVEVPVRAFMELFTPNESAGVFRVREAETTRGRHAGQILYLEDALTTLSDDIAIGVQATSGTFRHVVSAILDAQTVKRWVVGEVELPDDYELVYAHSYDNLLKAIMDLVAMLPTEYIMQTDTLSYPWKINIRKLPDEFCECRLNRNMSSVQVIMDSSEQCNRVYAFGAGEGTDRISLTSLTGSEFLQDAESVSTWGPISRMFANENIFDSLTLKEVAQRYVQNHKDPKLSICIDASDIYKATGITIDHFRLGHACRVPMPVYGAAFTERVIAMEYPDVYNNPQNVVLTLANKVRVATDEIAKLLRDATNSKLIGGTVQSVKTEFRNDSVTQTDALVHYFDITGYGNVLAVLAEYSPAGACRLNVDSLVDIPLTETDDGKVDLLRYLKSDANRVPTVGRHYVTYFAKGTDYVNVYSKVTVKSIEKKGGGGSSYIPSTSGYFITSEGDYLVTSDGNKFQVAGGTGSSSAYQLITWNGEAFVTTDGNNYKVLGG